MPTLITGSFAYDTIMVFRDRFANHILPEHAHILNVSFLVPELRREFGGCAGNIAYNLKLLGGEPLPMGAVGRDFAPYRAWLQENDIPLDFVTEAPGEFTAQAFVTTDRDNNQITAFHPGAMAFAEQNRVGDVGDAIDLGIVAPDGRQAMLDHAAQFAAAGIPFIFDPGQGLPMFDGDELRAFIKQAGYVVVNDYESELLRDKTGLQLAQIAAQVKALIITRGGDGADIYVGGGGDDGSGDGGDGGDGVGSGVGGDAAGIAGAGDAGDDKGVSGDGVDDGAVGRGENGVSDGGAPIHIDAVRVSEARDPTGCGDAFRAGLLYGIARGLDWRACGQIASLMGGIKVEHHGTQNHRFTHPEFEARYHKNFATKIRLGD
ncbi:MAG: carbohydrate kinase family protein [Gammaproteobacteria bacterium]|nr:carbohydrate kinase family protein [Gammaproteobacteria bacterium]